MTCPTADHLRYLWYTRQTAATKAAYASHIHACPACCADRATMAAAVQAWTYPPDDDPAWTQTQREA
jgi:hypothetical protein